MANTWHGSVASSLPPDFHERKADANGKASYEVRRAGDLTEFSVVNAGRVKVTAPVRAMVGGKRHGVSFLLGMDQFGGISLERPAMIEARYALSPTGSLVLSPGFLKETGDREDELGRVLSPTFEQRCLGCHGKPDTPGAGKQGGVRCESCHGSGLAHVNSFSGAKGALPSVRPDHL
ncbi:MAG: hypothetical protein WBW33_16465, partial [Bryobacteraceae bacterium]